MSTADIAAVVSPAITAELRHAALDELGVPRFDSSETTSSYRYASYRKRLGACVWCLAKPPTMPAGELAQITASMAPVTWHKKPCPVDETLRKAGLLTLAAREAFRQALLHGEDDGLYDDSDRPLVNEPNAFQGGPINQRTQMRWEGAPPQNPRRVGATPYKVGDPVFVRALIGADETDGYEFNVVIPGDGMGKPFANFNAPEAAVMPGIKTAQPDDKADHAGRWSLDDGSGTCIKCGGKCGHTHPSIDPPRHLPPEQIESVHAGALKAAQAELAATRQALIEARMQGNTWRAESEAARTRAGKVGDRPPVVTLTYSGKMASVEIKTSDYDTVHTPSPDGTGPEDDGLGGTGDKEVVLCTEDHKAAADLARILARWFNAHG